MRLTISRTGGFAGLSRRWSTSVDPADPPWHELLHRLPWDDVGREAPGVDRFVYVVTFEPRPEEVPQRRCEIPEHRFTGAWQELLERVRDSDGE